MTPACDIIIGNALTVLRGMPEASVNCVVTSPPYYGLRDYKHGGQIGLEKTPDEYVAKLVAVFGEVRRVLRDDGVAFLNLGDSYASGGTGGYSPKSTLQGYSNENTKHRIADKDVIHGKPPKGLPAKNLLGIPWRVAFALQSDGWILRQDIIWAKPNPMPESVTDRCTKAHEYIFLLTKRARYWWDGEAIKERSVDPESLGGMRKRRGDKFVGQAFSHTRAGFSKIKEGTTYEHRNRRSVWTIITQPYPDAHFATFPEELPRLCVLAGCPVGGTVLDPFAGSGTTGKVALDLGRNAVLIEINPDYVEMARRRTNVTPGMKLEATK